MPEHFHLLISEPELGNPSVGMKVMKERFTRQLSKKKPNPLAAQGSLWSATPAPVWQKRSYDFNVWSERKRVEKLRYMHRNPVKRGFDGNSRAVEVEQFSSLHVWREWCSEGHGSGMAAGDKETSGCQVW